MIFCPHFYFCGHFFYAELISGDFFNFVFYRDFFDFLHKKSPAIQAEFAGDFHLIEFYYFSARLPSFLDFWLADVSFCFQVEEFASWHIWCEVYSVSQLNNNLWHDDCNHALILNLNENVCV